MQRGGEEDQWQKGPFGHFLMNHITPHDHHITHNHMTPHDHHITHNHMTPHDHHMPRDHHIAPHDHMTQHDHHITSHDHMSSDNRHHHQRQQFENYVSSQPWSLTGGHHHHLTTTPPPQPQQPPPGLVSTHHPNQGSTGPSLDYVGASLGPARSYSVSQDLLSDMNIARSPLLRSSSDVGTRLKQYQTGTYSEGLDGILDSSLDSVDGTQGLDSAFFPDVSPQRVLPSSSTPPAPPPPTSCTSSPSAFPPSTPAPQSPVSLASPVPPASPASPATPASPFSFYPSDREHVLQGMSHNITSKLHNFTESLGVLFSPVDHFSTHPPSPGKTPADTFVDGGVHSQHPESGGHVTNAPSLPGAAVTPCRSHPVKPEVQPTSPGNKPSYSDVLSKNTTQNLTVPPVSSVSSSPSTEINAGIPSKAEVPPMAGISRSATSRPKQHRTGVGNVTSGTKAASKSGNHSPASRVGLDEFEVSSSSSQPVNEWLDMENLVINAVQSGMQSQTLHSNSNSPAHFARKAKKSELKKQQQQQQQHHHNQALADQLNNKVSSAQPKQAPRRTSYINNILNVPSSPSSSPSCNTSSCSPTPTVSTNSSTPFTLPHNSCGPTISNSSNGNDLSGGFVNSKAENGRPRPKEDRRSCEDTTTCPGGGNTGWSKQFRNKPTGVSNNTSSRGDQRKDSSNKRSNNNKRKKDSPYADLLYACWSVIQRWLGLVIVFVLWLGHLVLDVSVMSSRLLLHLLHLSLHWSLEKWRNLLSVVKYYSSNLASYFRWNRSEEKKMTGRGERKSSRGLDCNIGLPTTGEEAMKRLLACRGKDPYSILGVTRDANDDDIKKYYKRQAILVHPDKNKQPGAEEAFKILAHAFELIGQPERRCEYDAKLEEETQMEGAWGELASLLTRLQEKLEEAANTIRCTNCNKRHRRTKLPRPIYAARLCNDCNIHHASREGDIWAESVMFGLRWRYYACMEGAVYDISEWAACQSENLKHLQANTHSVQYRIVSGKKTPAGKNSINDFPSDPDLEEFFNNLCREKFGKNYTPPSSSAGQHNQQSTDARKRKGKKKK